MIRHPSFRLALLLGAVFAATTCGSHEVSGPDIAASPRGERGLTPAAGEQLFGTTRTGSLYRINSSTGAATLVGPIGFGTVSAIDFHPTTGELFGIGYRGGSVDVLIRIDTATGAGTEVGPTSFDGSVPDISFRSDGTLFAYEALSFDNRLWTVNTTTGASTLLGSTGLFSSSGNGIAHGSTAGVLYHSNSSFSHILNQTTGTATPLALMSNGCSSGRIAASDQRPSNGAYYGIRKCGFPGGSESLVTVSYLTGVVTVIGPTTAGMDGLAWEGVAGDVPGQTCEGLPTTPGVRCVEFQGVTACIGTDGNDVISMTDGPDGVLGLQGNDRICLFGGIDTADGGGGNDRIHGGDDKDVLFGKQGSDFLFGERGPDRLDGGHTPVPSSSADLDTDTCVGGPQGDKFFLCEVIID